MWHAFADAIRLRLREFPEIDSNHPVFSDRPYKVFLHNPPRSANACCVCRTKSGKRRTATAAIQLRRAL
jgi:hypothetical protein